MRERVAFTIGLIAVLSLLFGLACSTVPVSPELQVYSATKSLIDTSNEVLLALRDQDYDKCETDECLASVNEEFDEYFALLDTAANLHNSRILWLKADEPERAQLVAVQITEILTRVSAFIVGKEGT